jgi:DNA-binding MarR family transcriptional regulator
MARKSVIVRADHTQDVDLDGVWSKDATVGYLVREVHRALFADLQARIGPYGVNAGMWRFLRVLWEEDAISQRDLSARVGMTAATTALALDRMEREALVLRVRDGKDRRIVRVHLTKEGRRMRDKLLPHAAEVNAIACAGIGRQKLALLMELLEQVRMNIKTKGKLAQKD